MPVAPTVSELPLQDIRFLFAGIPQIRMLPDKLKQTGKAGLGEFKLVAHFPASMSNTEADKKAYMARHATFQNGQYGIYYDGTYKLDEIKWDATNRAGVHLVTQDKYGNTVQFPVAPSKSVPGDLKLMISEYVESLVNPPVMIRCSGLGGRITPDANNPGTFDLTVNPQQPKCPVKARNHVPAKYHAENVELDHGRYVVDASALTDAEIEYLDFYLYRAEEGNTPVMPPMEFGEMANWRPLDGTPGLKRNRAEAETLKDYSDQGAIQVDAEIVYNWWVEDGPDNLNEWDVDQEVKSQVTYEFNAGDYGQGNQSSFEMPRSWDEDEEVTVQYEWKLVIGNHY